MQPFPTVKQIQQTLPFSPVFQNETTDADGEAYGLPVIMGGELAPVMRTLVLYDENMRYYVCAVLKAHSWEPKYNSAGCKAQTIAGWDVTLARQSSKLGQTLLQVEFGQNVTLFGLNMLVLCNISEKRQHAMSTKNCLCNGLQNADTDYVAMLVRLKSSHS